MISGERRTTGMKQFEYQISLHSSATFKEVVYFCSEEGRCTMEEVPSDQIGKLENILNDYGKKGWELVQALFGKDGVMVFWKRAVGE
jgi:hypothetical protein